MLNSDETKGSLRDNLQQSYCWPFETSFDVEKLGNIQHCRNKESQTWHQHRAAKVAYLWPLPECLCLLDSYNTTNACLCGIDAQNAACRWQNIVVLEAISLPVAIDTAVTRLRYTQRPSWTSSMPYCWLRAVLTNSRTYIGQNSPRVMIVSTNPPNNINISIYDISCAEFTIDSIMAEKGPRQKQRRRASLKCNRSFAWTMAVFDTVAHPRFDIIVGKLYAPPHTWNSDVDDVQVPWFHWADKFVIGYRPHLLLCRTSTRFSQLSTNMQLPNWMPLHVYDVGWL